MLRLTTPKAQALWAWKNHARGNAVDSRKGPCDPPPDPDKITPYECRKFGCDLPCDSVCPPFECLYGIPTGVFRRTDGEQLGPGADKCGCYKVPEYFSFHHMSFYDIHLCLRPCRMPSAVTGRKP